MNINSHNFHCNSGLIFGSLMVRESRLVAERQLDGVDDEA